MAAASSSEDLDPVCNTNGMCAVPGNVVGDSTRTLQDGTVIPTVGLGVYQTTPGPETYNAVLHALKVGYRHIDTAALYKNEADVGRAVRDSGVPREEIFITSKLWSVSRPPSQPGYDYAMEQATNSFQRLGTYMDLYLIHSPHHKDERLEMWRALEDLVQINEKVRAIGVSNYGVHHLQEIFKVSEVWPVVNQIELHPFLQRREIVAFCQHNNIALEAYSPLVQAQKMDNPILVEMAKRYMKTEAQILIRWSLQKGYITLPKSKTPHRITENADVFTFGISAEDMATLDSIEETYGRFNTGWEPMNMD